MSQGKNEGDPFVMIMISLGLLGALGWVVWYAFGAYIVEIFRWLRIGQLWVIEQITMNAKLHNLRVVASQAPAVTWNQVLVLSDMVMTYLKWPLAAGLAFWAYRKAMTATDSKYKQKHSLESLMKAQAKTWPVIAPILNFNPTQTSARVPGKPVPETLPLFAEALSPEEWVAFNRISLVNGVPDRDSMRRAFMPQLGGRWAGVDSLPPYARPLFAAFALKAAQKRQQSDELLGKIALCWSPEKGLVLDSGLSREIEKMIDDPAVGGEALTTCSRYAYTTTALLGLLKYAREQGGVLAPATFLWLRGVDRNLWYPLNNLGRQSFLPEASGAMSHFMSELNARKALVIPRLESAVDALVTYYTEARPVTPPLGESKNARLSKPAQKR